MRKLLTSVSVAALPVPENGQYDCWDRKQPGFGIRVSYGGAKRWVLMYGSGGIKKRLVVGNYPAMGVSDARLAARRYLGEIVGGKDPAGERAEAKCEPTVAELAALYLEKHAARYNKPRT